MMGIVIVGPISFDGGGGRYEAKTKKLPRLCWIDNRCTLKECKLKQRLLNFFFYFPLPTRAIFLSATLQ
jgi:hypothetical protein